VGKKGYVFVTFPQHHNLSAVFPLLIAVRHEEHFCIKKCARCLEIFMGPLRIKINTWCCIGKASRIVYFQRLRWWTKNHCFLNELLYISSSPYYLCSFFCFKNHSLKKITLIVKYCYNVWESCAAEKRLETMDQWSILGKMQPPLSFGKIAKVSKSFSFWRASY